MINFVRHFRLIFGNLAAKIQGELIFKQVASLKQNACNLVPMQRIGSDQDQEYLTA